MTAAARCQLTHLPPGHYPAPVGSIPISHEEHARLLHLSADFTAEVSKRVDQARATEAQARADLLTGLREAHTTETETLRESLGDARAELKDREDRLRTLFTERHADLKVIGDANQARLVAENRDARIAAEDNQDLRKRQTEIVLANLNVELWKLGVQTLSSTLGPVVPMIGVKMLGTKSEAVAQLAASTDMEKDPPLLCNALCHLLWRVRRPALVQALATALCTLSGLPQLQPLGLALQAEAPDAFAAVMAALAQTASNTTQPPGESVAPAVTHTNGAPAKDATTPPPAA